MKSMKPKQGQRAAKSAGPEGRRPLVSAGPEARAPVGAGRAKKVPRQESVSKGRSQKRARLGQEHAQASVPHAAESSILGLREMVDGWDQLSLKSQQNVH